MLKQVQHARDTERVLEVENLRVAYHRFAGPPIVAVNDINLSISTGEVVGLVGESGSGKTTLARAIMGSISKPGAVENGTIRFAGRDMAQLSKASIREIRGRDLTIVVPNPRSELNPLVRVGEQVANMARVHLGLGKEASRQAALEMFRSVSIPDPERRFHAYPHELSGGMAQRVVIAMALICSPKFVISDDATSGLDVTVQAQVLELLRRLVREQHSGMLYITRDIGVAAHFCDRVAILYEGEIVEVAGKDELFRNPRHPYTNMLMAAFAQHPTLRRRWHPEGPTVYAGLGRPGARCAYAGRCVKAQDRCVEEHPELWGPSSHHFARCHFPVER